MEIIKYDEGSGWIMNGLESLVTISIQEEAETEKILELAEKLDFLDIQILRKFYATGKAFPLDTQPYCFPILFKEMKENHNLKIGLEALRKRLNNLESLGLIEKIKRSNPSNYAPVRNKENLVRAVIVKFFLIHGLTKFL